MDEFWRWTTAQDGAPTLWIDGEITGDLAGFADALAGITAPEIVMWVNSPGGDPVAATAMYTALREYRAAGGKLTAKIDGIAASAASLLVMAADTVLMSPPSLMMIHNPWTIAVGDADALARVQAGLLEVRDAMVAGYAGKCGLPDAEIIALMDAETYMSAAKAVALGFADGVLYQDGAATGQMAATMVTLGKLYTAVSPARARADAETTERERVARVAGEVVAAMKK